MSGPLAEAVALAVVAVVLFGASVGVGILLGRRLDRFIEARRTRELDDSKGGRP